MHSCWRGVQRHPKLAVELATGTKLDLKAAEIMQAFEHSLQSSDDKPYSLTQPREDNFGIGIFSKLPLAKSKVCHIGSANIPSILATVDTGHTNLLVIATHPLPPGGRDYSHWRNEHDLLPDYIRSQLPVLLLGDLNVTPWNYHFKRLLARTGLRNSVRGFGIQPT